MGKRKNTTATPVIQPDQLQLLTIPQVMATLNLGRTKIYDLINNDGLPIVKIGGATRVPLTKLQAWIDQQATQIGA
ncbi:hypothetical protein KDH_31810 [Dictyobacter sp. S3.2.2.5]|uniref:Helix-turn-helix domain-containing protein n=1 Tax=Dictyobacter halimunensis TaxID=3026934 RepID=A0ABQ6FRH3_9CHLR|nr:hypothetical protein KDH_31810 [Dictyobacter sp. S3.2.2.5]